MSSLLSLDRVRKSHWRGAHEVVVLGDLSLNVHRGELVAIWGQRGSGKTTLARVAAGLELPEQGTVCFEGEQISKRRRAPAPLLHEGIGWVRRAGDAGGEFRTAADYVALPLLGTHSPRAARRHACATLRRVGVGGCAEEHWQSLTDGQRTLVAVAHALARDPRLLIADDPTAYLDVLQREQVMRLLRTTCDEQGLAVLVMVPDMPEMAYADQIGSLSDGRLVVAKPTPAPTNVIDFPAGERSA